MQLLLSGLLALIMTTSVHAAEFPDVREDDWYAPYVNELVDDGLVKGYPDGRFGSWDPVNRAELSKIIVNLKKTIQEDEASFWNRHLFELILSGITLLGWIIVLYFLKRPITVDCRCAREPELPDAPVPHPKNQTTNWWL